MIASFLFIFFFDLIVVFYFWINNVLCLTHALLDKHTMNHTRPENEEKNLNDNQFKWDLIFFFSLFICESNSIESDV